METLQIARKTAENNLLALKENHYPGRGIIAGMDETGKYLVQVYWIMGRSENSRNRIFVCEKGGILKTAAADPKKIKDPSLIIYTAMAENRDQYAVSNGEQTMDAVLNEEGLGSAMMPWEYEPDAPNFTSRITAIFDLSRGCSLAEMSILKKSPMNSQCNEHLYRLPLSISSPGLGYCITTYSGDGDPLPPFQGDPYLLPLIGGIKNVAQTIWDTLNEDNRVSLAVKFINIKTRQTMRKVINKYNVVG